MLRTECDDCEGMSPFEIYTEARDYLLDFDENGDRKLTIGEFVEMYDDFIAENDYDDGTWNNFAQT